MHQADPTSYIGERLLAGLGSARKLTSNADHPALAWRRSGLLSLSGRPGEEAKMVPLPLASAADGALLALRALVQQPEQLPKSGALLLGERSRLMGLRRNGRRSTTGHCRLLDAKDGRIAFNLARAEDWDLMAAWLEQEAPSWEAIEAAVSSKSATALVHRGAELGLPIALDICRDSGPWFEASEFEPVGTGSGKPLVVDLSSLWAGPLAGSLLRLAGCDVIKVESSRRPDGAREGHAGFFDLLNAGKKSVAIDFGSSEGRGDLKKLLRMADIVIEASRPRALRQLGIDAKELVAQKPGKVWVQMLAYGDDDNCIGFGDDIGVSAGLCTIMEKAWGEPCFVGDAIADPISGLYTALAAWAHWQKGGGGLLKLSMVNIVRHAMQIDGTENWPAIAGEWQRLTELDDGNLYPMRTMAGSAEALGASNTDIMARLC